MPLIQYIQYVHYEYITQYTQKRRISLSDFLIRGISWETDQILIIGTWPHWVTSTIINACIMYVLLINIYYRSASLVYQGKETPVYTVQSIQYSIGHEHEHEREREDYKDGSALKALNGGRRRARVVTGSRDTLSTRGSRAQDCRHGYRGIPRRHA